MRFFILCEINIKDGPFPNALPRGFPLALQKLKAAYLSLGSDMSQGARTVESGPHVKLG